MQPLKKIFNIETSLNRINAILDPSRTIADVDSSYNIDQLDYNTIVKAKMVYISVDLRSDNPVSSEDVLFKQYKACLAELIPIMAESDTLVDIDQMHLMNVIAIYSCRDNLNGIIDIAAKINSMCEVLNMQFENYGMPRLTPGIGISIGETHILRMTEAEPKSEEILRVSDGIGVSMDYSSIANTGLVKNPIIISPLIWEKLTEAYRQFFSNKEDSGYYYASLINTSLNNWIKENR